MEKPGKYPKNWIRELREARGWSQRELAEKADFPHYQTIANLERQTARLHQDQLTKLANALGVQAFEITEGPGQHVAAADDNEKELLQFFRGLDDSAKQMYLHTLRSFATAPADTNEQVGNAKDKHPAKEAKK